MHVSATALIISKRDPRLENASKSPIIKGTNMKTV